MNEDLQYLKKMEEQKIWNAFQILWTTSWEWRCIQLVKYINTIETQIDYNEMCVLQWKTVEMHQKVNKYGTDIVHKYYIHTYFFKLCYF